MVTETLELRVVVSGGTQASQQLSNIERSAKGANDALRFMRASLVLLSFARVFEGLFTAVNAFQQMFNKLRLVTNSSQEAADAQITLAKAAIETRASYEDTVNVFAALARSTKALNLDYGQLLTLTKEWNETIVVSGVDQQQARNALKDFIEELNLGVLQGRQLRALLMQNPEFLRLMAEGMSKVGKASDPWFAAVRKATEGGKTLSGAALFAINKQHPGSISSTEAIIAVMMGADEEAKKFNQTQTTIGQSWEILKTKALVFFATLTQKTGALDWLKQIMSWIGDHLDIITEAAAAFAALLIVNTVTSALTTFGGTIGSVFGLLFRSVTNLYSLLQRFFLLITSEAGALVLPFIVIGVAIYAAFHTQINNAASNFGKKVQEMGGWLEFLIRWFTTVETIIETMFGHLGLTLKVVFETIVNGIISAFQWMLNKIIDGVNWAGTKLNALLPASMNVGTLSHVEFGQVGTEDKAQLQAYFQKSLIENYATNKGMVKKIQDFFASFNLANMKGGLNLGGRPPGAGQETIFPEAVKDKTAQLKEATKVFEDYIAKFSPLGILEAKAADAEAVMAEAIKKHVDVQGILNKMGVTWNDVIRESQREALGFKNDIAQLGLWQKEYAQAVREKVITAEEAAWAMRQKTITALENEHDVISGINVAILKYNEGLANQAAIANTVVSDALKQNDALNKLQVGYIALKTAVDNGIISSDRYVQSLRDLQIEFLKTQTDASSGFVSGMLEVQKSMDDVASTASDALKNAFKGVEDALVTFVTTGKLNIHDLANSILADFARLAVQGAIMKPLADLLGFGAGQTSGTSPLTSALSSIFGGSGGLPGAGALGQLGTIGNPMYVVPVGGAGIPGVGSLGGLLGGSQNTASGGGGFLGGLFDTGGFFGSGGGFMSFLGDIGSLFGFAEGGDFMVGGRPGKDSNLVAFRASADERVKVMTPSQQRAEAQGGSAERGGDFGGLHLHLHGVQDVDSFRRSKSQVAAGMGVLADHARRRIGQG